MDENGAFTCDFLARLSEMVDEFQKQHLTLHSWDVITVSEIENLDVKTRHCQPATGGHTGNDPPRRVQNGWRFFPI